VRGSGAGNRRSAWDLLMFGCLTAICQVCRSLSVELQASFKFISRNRKITKTLFDKCRPTPNSSHSTDRLSCGGDADELMGLLQQNYEALNKNNWLRVMTLKLYRSKQPWPTSRQDLTCQRLGWKGQQCALRHHWDITAPCRRPQYLAGLTRKPNTRRS
jgi:hypothetical protein